MMREDWVEVELGEILRVSSGSGLTAKKMTGSGYPVYGGNGVTGYHSEYLFDEQKLIIGRVGVRCGVTHITKSKAWVTDNALVVTFKQPFFDLRFMKLKLQFENLNKLSNSTAQPVISGAKIYAYSIVIPPLPEQRAIVAKIEELFSDLDKGIADLTTAQAQLKVYRQAVLKKAFEGELTKEWREQQTDLPTADELLSEIRINRDIWIDAETENGKNEPRRIRTKLNKLKSAYPSDPLPKQWKWTNFISACQFVIDCHNKTAPYEDQGIFLVRTSNIRNGKLDLVNKIKYVSQDTYEFWSKRGLPKSGDIIFTREAPMGEAAIIPTDTKICLGQRTMLLRTNEKWLGNKYLLYNILSEVFQQRFRKNAIGTGVKHLRVGDVESLAFPICSREEQHQIVREIESRLSVCDQVERSIVESLEKARALRQSILKKAFEGRLLSEEEIAACKAAPDYEPASVLLARIERSRKEKINAKKKK